MKHSRWLKGCPILLVWLLPKVVSAFVRQFRREASAAQANAERSIALSAEHGLTDFLAMATVLRGWAMAEQGRHEEGIAQIQEGLAALRATGAEWRGRITLSAGRGVYEDGPLRQGADALTEALAAADEHENRNSEAEIHRLKGELLLRRGRSQTLRKPRAAFERAIEVARKQSAKSLELRATTSLARLLAKQGRRDEARAMLADIYGWFTEGFDTADLKDAKALLDQLNSQS